MKLKKNNPVNLLAFLLLFTFYIGATEVGLRLFYKDKLGMHVDERNLTYRYDSNLGWFPVENSKKVYTGSRTIHVEHNSRGFRDSEHIVGPGPGIIFLGDSLVWGYDAEKEERFTDKLGAKLPDWSVYNLGVSGYGTDQEYLLLKQHIHFYRPRIVFLVFCTDNDEVDNSTNMRYGGYYKPYFMMNGASLVPAGVPVPQSQNYFFIKHNVLARSYLFRWLVKSYYEYKNPPKLKIDNPTYALISDMRNFVESSGARFIVGLQGRSPRLEKYLTASKVPFVSLANRHRYPTHGGHWNPRGNAIVSEKIYKYLVNRGYLQQSAMPD